MDEASWYKPRTYLHFDPPINQKTAEKYVTQASYISTHSFYPLISFTSSVKKFGFDPETGTNIAKNKDRPISYASHLDSHIYAYYCSELSKPYELELVRSGLSKSILAFRALSKSNIHFAHDVFNEIRSRGECCALAFDIKGFFDNLDHELLKKSWASLLNVETLPKDHYSVFKSITRYSKVDKQVLYEKLGVSLYNPKVTNKRLCTPKQFRELVRGSGLVEPHLSDKGIPQGSPISALLSNIYMLSFDKEMVLFLSKFEAPYYRYCDDMIIIADLNHEEKIQKFVEQKINEVKLNLQPKKTEIRHFTIDSKTNTLHADKPLQYLGFSFDGSREHIRSSSISRYYKKLRKRIWTSRKAMERNNALRASRSELPRGLFLRTIHKGYSYPGRRNFLSYGYRAAKIMNSRSIKKQLRPHWGKLNKLLENARKGY